MKQKVLLRHMSQLQTPDPKFTGDIKINSHLDIANGWPHKNLLLAAFDSDVMQIRLNLNGILQKI